MSSHNKFKSGDKVKINPYYYKGRLKGLFNSYNVHFTSLSDDRYDFKLGAEYIVDYSGACLNRLCLVLERYGSFWYPEDYFISVNESHYPELTEEQWKELIISSQ